MATMPTYLDGTLIDPDKWNAHANQINANTSAIATNTAGLSSGTTRISTLETNQGTRGSYGPVFTEIGNLTNRKVKSYTVNLATPGSILVDASANLGSIAIPNPGFTYTLWFSMSTGPQWAAGNGFCDLAIQTSSTWGTGVLAPGAIYGQVSGYKMNGGIWFTTDGNQARTGAITIYAMIRARAAAINGMGVGTMSVMVVPS